MPPVEPSPSTTQWQTISSWLGTGSLNLFGMPLAGKDTQCRRLAERLNAAVISGGDILRSGQEVPDNVRAAAGQGRLVSSDKFLHIALPYLAKAEFVGRALMLSSVGRWHGEEEAVMQAAAAAGHPIKAVVFLAVDELVVRRRLQELPLHSERGQRADDNSAIFERRLVEFQTKTLPVLDFYREQDLLIEVDGAGAADEVEALILAELSNRAGQTT